MSTTELPRRLLRLAGYETRRMPLRDRLLSGIGGALAILAVLLVSSAFTGADAGLVVASMGASAVLLFAVPHGPLSQPWQLVAGHLISAIIGVTCARFVTPVELAAATAVGLSIIAMRLTHSIHPPGGATALTAVVGGSGVTALGYQFVLTPVLLNVAVMLAVAVGFNAFFRWRRYPAAWGAPAEPAAPGGALGQADLVYALSEMDTFVDVSEQDLQRIFELATRHAAEPQGLTEPLQTGHCYSNGRYGQDWQVRQILEIRAAGEDGREVVTYRVLAGSGRRHTGKAGALEFRRWARHRVERNENSWRRVDEAASEAPPYHL
jgi:CBS-domain-containing membrane protein